MNLIDALLHTPLAQAIGWALIHLTWQATLVAVALALAIALMRKSSASARYATAWAALALTLVLAIATGSVVYERVSAQARARALVAATAAPAPAAAPVMIPAGIEKISGAEGTGWRLTFLEPAALLRTSLPWVVALWFAGVALLSGRLLIGFLYTSRVVRSATPSAARWSDAVERIAASVGVRQTIRVLESARIAVPTVVGWLKPVIVLPAAALAGMSPEQFETILAHELAHIRRHDFVLNVLQVAIETLLFYHPAVWWISRQVRIERENCCDDIAVAVCGDPVEYAQALAHLEIMRAEVPLTVVASTGGSLLSRIRRLVGQTEERWPLTPTFVSAGVLLSAAAILIVLPMHLFAESPAKAQAAAPVAKTSSVKVDVVASQPQQADKPKDTKPQAKSEAGDEEDFVLPEPPDSPEPPLPPRHAGHIAMLGSFDFPEIHIPEIHVDVPDIPDIDVRLAEVRDLPMVIGAGGKGFYYGFSTGDGGHHVTIDDPDHIVDFDHPSADDAKWMKELEIDAAYLNALKGAGYGKLKARELASMKATGVTADYATRMNATFGSRLEPRQLTHMKVLRVTPEYVSEIRATGYGNFTPEDYGRFRITGVKAETLKKLQADGKKGLSAREIVREHLGGDAIRRSAAAAWKTREMTERTRQMREQIARDAARQSREMERQARELHERARQMEKNIHIVVPDAAEIRRSMGVTPEFESEMKAAGLDGLSQNELMKLRMMGVTGDYIREMKKAGVDVKNVDRLVRMKMMGISPSYLSELAKSGYSNLSVDDLIRLRRSGVDADFLRELRALKEK